MKRIILALALLFGYASADAATFDLGDVVTASNFGLPGPVYQISRSGISDFFSDGITFTLPTPLPLPTSGLTPGFIDRSVWDAIITIEPINLNHMTIGPSIEGTFPLNIPIGLLFPSGQQTVAFSGFSNGGGSYTADIYFTPAIYAVSAVPEADTWLMLLIGAGFIAWRMRRTVLTPVAC